jgi:hypothetical protein
MDVLQTEFLACGLDDPDERPCGVVEAVLIQVKCKESEISGMEAKK